MKGKERNEIYEEIKGMNNDEMGEENKKRILIRMNKTRRRKRSNYRLKEIKARRRKEERGKEEGVNKPKTKSGCPQEGRIEEDK